MELAQVDRSLSMLRAALADPDKVANPDDPSNRAAILRQHYRQVRLADLVTLFATYDEKNPTPPAAADSRIEHLRRLVDSLAGQQTPAQLGDSHITIDAGSVAALMKAVAPPAAA